LIFLTNFSGIFIDDGGEEDLALGFIEDTFLWELKFEGRELSLLYF
jgi:hypothetical protein